VGLGKFEKSPGVHALDRTDEIGSMLANKSFGDRALDGPTWDLEISKSSGVHALDRTDRPTWDLEISKSSGVHALDRTDVGLGNFEKSFGDHALNRQHRTRKIRKIFWGSCSRQTNVGLGKFEKSSGVYALDRTDVGLGNFEIEKSSGVHALDRPTWD
jgi:hypothetical protein